MSTPKLRDEMERALRAGPSSARASAAAAAAAAERLLERVAREGLADVGYGRSTRRSGRCSRR